MENQNPQPIQEVQVSTPPPVIEPEKKKFPFPKYVFLGIVFMVLLAIVGGAYFLGRNSVFKELNPTIPAIPSPGPVIYDPTADWQTYEGNGFSFKYPKNGKIEEYPPDAPAPAVILRIPNTSADLLVHIYANFTTVNDAINYKLDSEEKNQTYPSKYIKTNYNNGVIDGEKLVSEANPNTEYNSIDVYSQFKNKIYHLEYRYDDSEDRKKMLLLADQILSTFKFTDQLSASPTPTKTLTWKSYSNPYLPFSLKYPSDYLTQNFNNMDPNALLNRLKNAASETNTNVDDYVVSKYNSNGIDGFDDADNVEIGNLLPKSEFIPNNTYRYRGIRFNQYYIGNKEISSLSPYFKNNKGFSVIKINGNDVGVFDGTTKTTGLPPAYVKAYYFKMGDYVLKVGSFIFSSSSTEEKNKIFSVLDEVAKTIKITN